MIIVKELISSIYMFNEPGICVQTARDRLQRSKGNYYQARVKLLHIGPVVDLNPLAKSGIYLTGCGINTA